MNNQKKKSADAGKASIIIIIIILLVVGGVIISNFVGPGKGWIDQLVKGKKIEEKVVESVPEPETPKPLPPEKKTVEEPKTAETEQKEEKSEVQKLYDSLFAKYRQKFPDPAIGKTYDVYLKSATVRGKLKEFSDGKIVIQKTGVTVTYRIDTVSKKSYPTLFPKKAAKILALKEMKKILEERVATAEADEKNQEYTVVTNKTSASTLPSSQGASPSKFAYEPEAQATPERLKKPLAAFAEWVKMQQRRVGGKLGEKIYAKQQGRNVVLYMETSKLFRQQSYDIRFTVAEGMWQIWGFKCLDHGAARGTNQTHIVLLDNKNKIIGGSTKDDSSNIWVKK